MDGMDAILDAPEIETGAEEVESGVETAEDGAERVEAADGAEQELGQQAEPAKDDPYTTRYSREMRAALRQWETDHPEAAKYARQARDNHARLFALQQLEPKGIDGVREKYAMLDGLSHGDIKGAEALTAMQEQMRGIEEVDELLAKGDPRAFDAFGEDFNQGIAKLAPAFLDRVAKADPAAFEAAILPHVVSTLAGSDLLKEFNALVDVLASQNDPRFDEPTKMRFTIQQMGKMAGLFNSMGDKAGQLKTAATAQAQPDALNDERTKFERERQDHHWNTQIFPDVRKFAEQKFTELMNPYQKRLGLSPKQRDSAFADFRGKLARAMEADKDYSRQYNGYRAQKFPDAKAVNNFVRLHITKAAKNAFEDVKSERWEAFLNGKPKPKAAVAQPGKVQPAAGPNVEIRTVKPAFEEIDHRNTPLDWLARKQYRLNSGKVVQYRPQV